MSDIIIEKLTLAVEHLAEGNLSYKYEALSNKDSRIESALAQMVDHLKAVVKHMNLIAQGRYDIDFLPRNENDELGLALSEMTEMLREMSNENKKSAWIKSGQAELANIIRGDQGSLELGNSIISFLARYTNALVGTLYQVAINSMDTLEMIGSFAYDNRKKNRQMLKFGEGLVGQCALEKEPLVFENVPDDYMISSSLGELKPKQIIVIPFLIEQEIIGVMELGNFVPFDATKIDLLRQVSQNIALALKSSQNSEKVKILLGDNKF